MKISSLIPSLAYSATVGKKEGLDSDARRKKQEESGNRENPEDAKDEELSFDLVSEQLAQFSEENAAQLSGISASVDGSGPGLKVTLKDGKGSVVREISGEEFMQMRESSRVSGRGHLIDKKL